MRGWTSATQHCVRTPSPGATQQTANHTNPLLLFYASMLFSNRIVSPQPHHPPDHQTRPAVLLACGTAGRGQGHRCLASSHHQQQTSSNQAWCGQTQPSSSLPSTASPQSLASTSQHLEGSIEHIVAGRNSWAHGMQGTGVGRCRSAGRWRAEHLGPRGVRAEEGLEASCSGSMEEPWELAAPLQHSLRVLLPFAVSLQLLLPESASSTETLSQSGLDLVSKFLVRGWVHADACI